MFARNSAHGVSTELQTHTKVQKVVTLTSCPIKGERDALQDTGFLSRISVAVGHNVRKPYSITLDVGLPILHGR
jgi:hypothetical protein